MDLNTFLQNLQSKPDSIDFSDTMSIIDKLYHFTPCEFKNGNTVNEAGQNNGSCKLFAFASMHNLSEQETLACFGTYYRDDVLNNPAGDDHQNIRNFMQHGWNGIEFSAMPLKPVS